MRVLHVINSMQRAGAERHLANILEPLARLGIQNHLATLVAGNAFELQVAPWVDRCELALEDRYGLLALPRLTAMARDVDLVHTQLTRSDVFGRASAALAGRPAVTTVQMSRYLPLDATVAWRERGRNTIVHTLDRATARQARRFIAVSAAARDTYQHHLGLSPRQSVLIPNSIDLRAFDPRHGGDRATARARVGFPQEGFAVLMLARFEAQKAHDVAIRAVAEAARKAPVHLYIAGHGSTEPAMRALADALSAPVTFLGLRSDVVSLLSAADLFLLPSRFEGMPLALIEALAMGTTALCSDIPENRETAAHAAAYSPPDDVPALAANIVRLYRSPDERRRLSEIGRAQAHAYDARTVAARIAQVFHEVLQDQPLRQTLAVLGGST